MLDDTNVLRQRDPSQILEHVSELFKDTQWTPVLENTEHDDREILNVVIAGMGGSALAADILSAVVRSWLGVPIEVIKGYDLPGYAWQNTLVIASSHSGNTEETLSCYQQARDRGCQLAVLTSGGKILSRAREHAVMTAVIPAGGQPRMATIKHLKALLALFESFRLLDSTLSDKVAASHDWLRDESQLWHPAVPVHENYAKQIALQSVGKTPVIYGGPLTAPLAYKWKISWNENAKNIAFCNQFPEMNHNEFIGWSSHPIDKPFVVFDLRSDLEPVRITERMELTDRLLSGKRPKAIVVELAGDTSVAQCLWACILADAASCYTAILNGVNPGPVELVERFKSELS